MENGQESPAPKATGKAVLLLTLALILNGTELFAMGLIESMFPPWLSVPIRMGVFGFYWGISLAVLVGVWLWTRTYAPSLSVRGGQGALLSALVALCSCGFLIFLANWKDKFAAMLTIILLGWFLYGLIGLILSGLIRISKLRGFLHVPNSQTLTTRTIFFAMFFAAVATLMIKEIMTWGKATDPLSWFQASPITIQQWVFTLSMLTAVAVSTACLTYLKIAGAVFNATRKYTIALVPLVLILPSLIHILDQLVSAFLGMNQRQTMVESYLFYLPAELSLILGLRLVIGLLPINRAALA